MSNEVYGYVNCPPQQSVAQFLRQLEQKSGIGISQIPFEELYNIPETALPKKTDVYFAFLISDKPGGKNASYLIDALDYAPEADIGLPRLAIDRVSKLVALLKDIAKEDFVSRLVVAICDSSNIEDVMFLKADQLEDVIGDDLKYNSPPDRVYFVE
ncbi:hypothetical protein K3X41_03090 [Aliiroseovarius crassostreae]|uniref:hypothetical protein n=1 Tax=Aliiroseovarius crassostreae TaxID=154981 RepID=UPI00220EE80F|nr:hypothetical protein [Aliiroseovarius crassostreae]UWQ08589.1 hypothetical protein K3X25_03095 [Aliiroseovarius crassostreae]UWQ11694.1 hypothetical protein K3X41_03090 [Aliiroseovarius crassostreae]